MSVTVRLAPHEQELAAWVAERRQGWNKARGHQHAHDLGARDDDRDIGLDRLGATAELAVARYWDLFWLPLWDQLDKSKPDVGNLHVRGTNYPNGCLVIHKTDPDDGVFVLVVVDGNEVHICGWLRAVEGKQDRHWRTDTGRPAFFVKQRYLRGVERCPVVVVLG